MHSCAYILCYIGSKHKTLNFYSLFSIIIEKQTDKNKNIYKIQLIITNLNIAHNDLWCGKFLYILVQDECINEIK